VIIPCPSLWPSRSSPSYRSPFVYFFRPECKIWITDLPLYMKPQTSTKIGYGEYEVIQMKTVPAFLSDAASSFVVILMFSEQDMEVKHTYFISDSDDCLDNPGRARLELAAGQCMNNRRPSHWQCAATAGSGVCTVLPLSRPCRARASLSKIQAASHWPRQAGPGRELRVRLASET
jgi:hypothetical protein